MKCPHGFQIGHDYGKCGCNECPSVVYSHCRNYNHSCIGKSDLGSKTMAEREARIHSGPLRDLIAYRCHYCGGWHIGTNWNV